MGVNNITTETVASYSVTNTEEVTTKATEEKKAETVATEEGVVYEKTSEEETGIYKINRMSEEERSALVDKLKQEQQARQEQLVNLVQQMLSKQATTFTLAVDDEDAIWKYLAKGDYTVDAATKEQAQKDIAEVGYYGVKQTSERMFDFACALAGDDVDKMKAMQEAMTKGFEEATKSWGQDLPEICQKTLDAANKLFEDYYASKENTTDTTTQTTAQTETVE